MNTQITFNQNFNVPNNYYYFENALSEEEIKLITSGISTEQLAKAGLGTKNSSLDSIRRSRVAFLENNDQWSWLYERLLYLASYANKEMWNFNLVSAPEMIQYTTYNANEEGHYGAHMDCGDGQASHRKVSITIQLSDPTEYEGGNLQLLKANENWIDAPRSKGGAVLFPSYLYHKVLPVTKGIRRSLVLWVGGDHFK